MTAYVTGAELKTYIQGGLSASTANDDLFDDLADEVTEAIDGHCHRSFLVPATTSVRYFRPGYCRTEVYDLDDIASLEDLAVAIDASGNGTYTALTVDTDYVAEVDARGMVTAIRSTGRFPTVRARPRSIRVTARYGWPEVPAPVIRAAYLWAHRLFDRKGTPTGVMGFAEVGGIRLSSIDPDVKALLAPYVDRARLVR